MDGVVLRGRAIVDRHTFVVVGVLVVLAVVCAGLTYATQVDPPTQQEERVESTWATSAEYSHGATVTRENAVFPVGTELSGRETYFTRVAPELDGALTAQYHAADGEAVDVSVETELVIRGVDGETVLWTQQRPLGATTAEDVPPDEPVTAAFTVNVSSVEDRVAAIQTDLGSVPGETEVFVRGVILVDGTVEGAPASVRRTVRLPIALDGDAYVVEDPGRQREPVERTEMVSVARSYGPLRTYGAPAIGAAALLGLLVLAEARRRGALALSPDERAYLRYLDDRAEFEEWITRIHLPQAAFDRPTAEAERLRDLAEFAIDADLGIVEDPVRGRYVMRRDDVVYTFDPPPDPRSDGSESLSSSGSGADAVPDDPDTEPGDSDGESGGDLEDVSLERAESFDWESVEESTERSNGIDDSADAEEAGGTSGGGGTPDGGDGADESDPGSEE